MTQRRMGVEAMVTRRQANVGLAATAVFAAAPALAAQEAEVMELPPPRADGGKPLIQALKLRRADS